MHAKDKVIADPQRLQDELRDELGRAPTEPELLARLTLFFSVCVAVIAARSPDPKRLISSAATQAEIGALETLYELPQ